MSSSTIDLAGRQQLESDDQRRNFHEALIRDTRPDPSSLYWHRVRAEQAKRGRARRSTLVQETISARRRHIELSSKLNRDGRMSRAEYAELASLDSRFDRRSYGTPTKTQVHVDAPLTELVASWGQGEMIADFLLPAITVSKRSGTIFKDDQGTLQRTDDGSAVAPGAPATEIDWTMDTAINFQIVDYKRRKTVPDTLVADATEPLNIREKTARAVAMQILLERERRAATLLQTAGSYLSANQIAAPSTKWDNADRTDNEHMDDIQTAHEAIADATGMRGTTFACNLQTAHALIRKTDFLERVKYTSQAMPDTLLDLIAQYVMCEEAYVGMARYKSSNPGAADTFADVWSDAPFILVVDPQPSEMYMGFGVSPTTDAGTALSYRHPEEDRESEVLWYRQSIDEVVTQSAAGAIFQDVLT